MKQSTKAVLLSAFIFPGAGHLLLKRYLSATLLIVCTATAGYFLITQTLEKTLRLTKAIQTENDQIDVTSLSEILAQLSSTNDSATLEIAMTSFIFIWVVAIIDASRKGNRHEHK